MALYTMKYGDLIDAGIITRADLPRAWEGFPTLVLPVEGEIDFFDVMYRRYCNHEIGGDTPAEFLRFLQEETLNVLDLLPDGLYANVLAAMVADATEETRTVGETATDAITRENSTTSRDTGTTTHGIDQTVTHNETINANTNRTDTTEGENTRDATTNGTQNTTGTSTSTSARADRAAPNGVVSNAYSTSGVTESKNDSADTTVTTNASEDVTNTENRTVTVSGTDVSTKTGTDKTTATNEDTVDMTKTDTGTATENADRNRKVTESVRRSGGQSGDINRAYAIIRDGKPLVMWIADRYKSCFMGVY